MTKIFGRLSVRALLGGLIGIMGLILSVMCASNLVNAWQHYDAGKRVTDLSIADKALFAAMQTFRIERGDTGSALASAGEQGDVLKKRVDVLRTTVDAQLAIVLPILEGASVPGLPAVREKLNDDYQAHKALRARVDAAMLQPSAARDKDLVQTFMPKAENLLHDMENSATVLETEMRLRDPAIGELALVRSTAWTARSALGTKMLPVIQALAKRQGLTPAELVAMQVNEGRSAVAWELVHDIVTREGAAPELRAAYDKAQSDFFGPATTQQLEGIVRSLSAGEMPQLALTDWQGDIAVRMATIGGVAGAAADLITTRAKETSANAEKMVILFAGMFVLSATLAVGGFILIQMRISRPITAIADVMRRLSANDLSVDVPGAGRSDEIGRMASAVLVFKDKMIEAERLRSEQAENEMRAATQRKSEMHKLADAFQAAVGNIVETVSSASKQLEATATTLTQTAETTQQLSTTVATASEEASDNVNSVASASEELAGSVNEIARQVQESSKIALEAVQQAQKTDARIAELSRAASRIGDVVKLITGVAEQTNLLALNATIEAARAGEAGKGFAVVAHEVKALAAQTAKATDEISTQIAGMQTATQDSVAAIKEIGVTIGRISEIASAISAAVEQQGAATQEISRNVQQAARGTAEVATNITDVNRGASATGSASSQVLSSARSLSNESNRLKIEVEGFLNTVRAA
jgi:methyl-accepting chemotaxis protein